MIVPIREDDLMASLDPKDEYFQIPIHRDSREFLLFVGGSGLSVRSPVLRTV